MGMVCKISSLGCGVPTVLPFAKRDLRLPLAIRAERRNSISGVQTKVLLSLVNGEFKLVESGGRRAAGISAGFP